MDKDKIIVNAYNKALLEGNIEEAKSLFEKTPTLLRLANIDWFHLVKKNRVNTIQYVIERNNVCLWLNDEANLIWECDYKRKGYTLFSAAYSYDVCPNKRSGCTELYDHMEDVALQIQSKIIKIRLRYYMEIEAAVCFGMMCAIHRHKPTMATIHNSHKGDDLMKFMMIMNNLYLDLQVYVFGFVGHDIIQQKWARAPKPIWSKWRISLFTKQKLVPFLSRLKSLHGRSCENMNNIFKELDQECPMTIHSKRIRLHCDSYKITEHVNILNSVEGCSCE